MAPTWLCMAMLITEGSMVVLRPELLCTMSRFLCCRRSNHQRCTASSTFDFRNEHGDRQPSYCSSAREVLVFCLLMKSIDRRRLASLTIREQKKFVDERPKSKALFERARKSLLSGVPMNWMVKWAGAFPPFVREAQGASFFDGDGHRYTDFCLGDTGAMTGHSPSATVKAVAEQARRG